MDIFGRNYRNPIFDSQNFATSIPILQHQFLSQPISPLISSFLTPPHQNRIQLHSSSSSCHPLPAILPSHPSPPHEFIPSTQVPLDVTRLPTTYVTQRVEHAPPFTNASQFEIKTNQIPTSNGRETLYKMGDQTHQNLCYVPYFNLSPRSSSDD